MAIQMNGDIHIRYMTLGRLKALLAEVEDDTLLVTAAEITGNLVFFNEDTFAYEAQRGWVDFSDERIEPPAADSP